MRLYLPIILCLIALFSSSFKSGDANNDDPVLCWSACKGLTYADFKGDTVGAAHAAVSCLKVVPWVQLEGNVLKYRVVAEFYADCSYMKSKDSRLLAHEQLHFDIVEVYARKMRRYLELCKRRRITTAEITVALTQIDTELHNVQATYDRITRHGLKLRAQAAWNRQVSASLDSLGMYGETGGRIELAPGFN